MLQTHETILKPSVRTIIRKLMQTTIEVLAAVALVLGILLCVLNSAYAADLICSSTPNSEKSKQDDFSVSLNSIDFSPADIPRLFSNNYKNNGNEPIRVCLLPEKNIATKELLASLEINREKFRAILNRQDKTDDSREIKLVNTESEMLRCVEEVYPAVGYVRRVSDARQELGCF